MKIVQLVSSLGVGGAEKFVVNLCLDLASNNNQVTLIALDDAAKNKKSDLYDRKVLDLLSQSGVSVVFMNCKRFHVLNIFLKLRNTLKALKPDVVHSHLLIWSVFLSFTPKRFKVVFTQHTDRLKLINFHRFWLKYRIDDYVAICDDVKKQIETISPSRKIVKIPNGINISLFSQPEQCSPHGKVYNFIIIARLEPVKNIELLINSAEILMKEGRKFKIAIVGDGSLMESLKLLIKSKSLNDFFELTGTRHDIPELLSISHTFILCSLHEGFSISLIEALSAGLDIIATDVGGNSEVLDHGRFGKLIENDNLIQLKQSMESSLLSPKVNNLTDRRDYLKNLSIEKCCSEHMSIYIK
jgi:glycosyltransferase involved in cell wall biosynthesis